eukprot:TRINITY_DN4441_c0_g1_i1.p1 TRINITY_DN4441_c0_g1~~TRINITY_DN4441_c0_g1_i1.p1  ORF type:complete len:192 (-),score=22.30 TRINITY_DN4441_c0_g1_i1:280-855(-)
MKGFLGMKGFLVVTLAFAVVEPCAGLAQQKPTPAPTWPTPTPTWATPAPTCPTPVPSPSTLTVPVVQPSIALNYIIAVEGAFPPFEPSASATDASSLLRTTSPNPFLGEIMLFGGNYAPQGWRFCHGQLLPISEFDALFAILGTTYGGDGRTTFALPDARGRAAVGFGAGPGLTPRSLGEQFGAETVTVTV